MTRNNNSSFWLNPAFYGHLQRSRGEVLGRSGRERRHGRGSCVAAIYQPSQNRVTETLRLFAVRSSAVSERRSLLK